MDNKNVILRKLQRKDYKELENIIRKTWKYDGMSKNPKDAEHMARLYLRSCLSRATFSCVAEKDGNVLGVILGRSEKSKKRFPIKAMLSQVFSIILLFTTKTGRKIGRLFQTFDRVDSELLKNSNQAFGGEVCFFALDESARGYGIGKRLFGQLKKYMISEKVKSFYLFTDSSCTYQFYEKRGMKRIGEKIVEFKPYTDYVLHMFLYGLEQKKKQIKNK